MRTLGNTKRSQGRGGYQGEKRGRGNALFLHCRNCDSLTVVAVAHFDLHLAGRHLASIGRAEDCFSRLQVLFVKNMLHNRVQFDPRSLKNLICS